MRLCYYSKLTAVLFLSLLLWNCRKRLEPTEIDMTEYGWVLYANGEYEKANTWFIDAVFEDSTYKDGYNGLGWTYGKLTELDSSVAKFNTGLALILQDTTDSDLNLLLSDPPHDVGKECRAGLTFAYHAKNQYQNAIQQGTLLLAATGDSSYSAVQGPPNWSFSRDESISSKQIIWTLASAHYSLGNFDQSLSYVLQLLLDQTTFNPNVNTVEGRRELADKIETLRDSL